MDLMFHAHDWNGQRACWSYLGFHEFRTRLAALAGVVLGEMQGFGGDRSWKGVGVGGIGELIRHADNSGNLTPGSCGRIAPNLQILIDQLVPDEEGDPGVSYDIQMGRILVKMMEYCAANDKPLEFIGASLNQFEQQRMVEHCR